MTVSDPYDLEPHKKKKPVSKKKDEPKKENKQQMIQVVTVNDELEDYTDMQKDQQTVAMKFSMVEDLLGQSETSSKVDETMSIQDSSKFGASSRGKYSNF